MYKSNEDCFYFLTSTCVKGSSCTYRHSPLALTCNINCPSWLRGNCLDRACPLRHSSIKNSLNSNGILCFYENTPMGCLKFDCTFIHSRPRMHLRNTPSKNNVVKSLASNMSIDRPPTVNPTDTNITSSQSTTNEIKSVIPISSYESSNASKSEFITHPSDMNENNSNLIKSTTRSVIMDSLQEPTTNQLRRVINRNVVVTESLDLSSRKINQTTTSNRIVVSSNNHNSIEKEKTKHIDTIEQENDTRQLIPCSNTTSQSSKQTTSTNNRKPIRVNRDRLPATKLSTIDSISTTFNKEKTLAGTELLQDDQRRTMRIERFQKKPISLLRSNIESSSMTTSNRNAVSFLSNERKRTAPETSLEDAPSTKRSLSLQQSSVISSHHTSIHNKNSAISSDKIHIRNVLEKNSPSTMIVSCQSVSCSSPHSLKTSRTKPIVSVINPSQIIEQKMTTENKTISSIKQISELQTSKEDENQLLEIDESNNVVNTFALIDEALLEADHVLELL